MLKLQSSRIKIELLECDCLHQKKSKKELKEDTEVEPELIAAWERQNSSVQLQYIQKAKENMPQEDSQTSKVNTRAKRISVSDQFLVSVKNNGPKTRAPLLPKDPIRFLWR